MTAPEPNLPNHAQGYAAGYVPAPPAPLPGGYPPNTAPASGGYPVPGPGPGPAQAVYGAPGAYPSPGLFSAPPYPLPPASGPGTHQPYAFPGPYPSQDRPGAGFLPDNRLRRLRSRPAESPARRAFGHIGSLFGGNDYPHQLASAVAGAQAPVAIGRRIAVVGSRGGSGRTTAAALLARVYAAMRADAVAALDTIPADGTLALRLDLPSARPFNAAASLAAQRPPSSLAELASILTPANPPNLLVAGRHSPPAEDGDAQGNAELLARAASRYCPITVFDCAPIGTPGTGWALERSHLAVFVASADASGLRDAADYGYRWQRDPELAGLPLLVLVTQPLADSPFDAAAEAGRLSRLGIAALPLGHDRHLRTGLELDLGLLARRTRLQAAQLAARCLALAGTGTGARA